MPSRTPNPQRWTLAAAAAAVLLFLWIGGSHDQARRDAADRETFRRMEKARVDGIIRQREVSRRDLELEVDARLNAGEDPAAVKQWADERSAEITAEAEQELRGE